MWLHVQQKQPRIGQSSPKTEVTYHSIQKCNMYNNAMRVLQCRLVFTIHNLKPEVHGNTTVVVRTDVHTTWIIAEA